LANFIHADLIKTVRILIRSVELQQFCEGSIRV